MVLLTYLNQLSWQKNFFTESFILVLRRVTTRRELPKGIHSDNGTNFIWPERAIKDALIKLTYTMI